MEMSIVGRIIVEEHTKDLAGRKLLRPSTLETYLLQLLTNRKITAEEYKNLNTLNESKDEESRYLAQLIIHNKAYGSRDSNNSSK